MNAHLIWDGFRRILAEGIAHRQMEGRLELARVSVDNGLEYKVIAVPVCPECGATLHACETGDPACLHCDNTKCAFTRRLIP